MTLLLAICVAVIFAVSVYLLLSKELKAVAMGASRPLPPFKQLIVDSPIIAFPPIPPKKPETMFPAPIASSVLPRLP